MALPPSYTDPKRYFEDCLQFLLKYRWIYDKPNTHLLLNKVYDKMPKEWLYYFQHLESNDALNNIALNIINENAPASFKAFNNEVNELKPKHHNNNSDGITIRNTIHLNQKKVHELLNLAPLIHSVCKKYGIKNIIDIGTGLGYLPQLLFDNYGYNVLGIEGNKKIVESARKYQEEQYGHSKNRIIYEYLFVTPNSADDIKQLFQKHFTTFNSTVDGICIVALHACADLSVHIVKMFSQITYAKCAVFMPCCYHRIEGVDTSFPNFPLSALLDECYRAFSERFITRPFLRLACQQSSIIWKDMPPAAHEMRGRNCLFRNILQEVVEEGNIKIIRKKRKTGGKSSDYNIETFVSNLEKSYTFIQSDNKPSSDDAIDEIRDKILNRYSSIYKGSECVIEALAGIQAAFQSLCENVILLDRCVYANELGLTCSTYKVTDDCISPRCFALLVSKE